MVVVGLWLMAVMVILRSYSGALTSLLAVRSIPIRINSLRDLVDAKEYKLIFEASTALTAYMKVSGGGSGDSRIGDSRSGSSSLSLSPLTF